MNKKQKRNVLVHTHNKLILREKKNQNKENRKIKKKNNIASEQILMCLFDVFVYLLEFGIMNTRIYRHSDSALQKQN